MKKRNDEKKVLIGLILLLFCLSTVILVKHLLSRNNIDYSIIQIDGDSVNVKPENIIDAEVRNSMMLSLGGQYQLTDISLRFLEDCLKDD